MKGIKRLSSNYSDKISVMKYIYNQEETSRYRTVLVNLDIETTYTK